MSTLKEKFKAKKQRLVTSNERMEKTNGALIRSNEKLAEMCSDLEKSIAAISAENKRLIKEGSPEVSSFSSSFVSFIFDPQDYLPPRCFERGSIRCARCLGEGAQSFGSDITLNLRACVDSNRSL